MMIFFVERILLAIVVFFACQHNSIAQEISANGTAGCNGTDGAECIVCIGSYPQLQSYTLDNQDLLDQLTETFYGTGEDTAQFVKITYDFQIYKSNATNSSNTTNSGNENMMNKTFNCTNQQELYVWSTSAYYLLGPEALYWFTLFAVNVRESSVTIQLPCLCEEMYDRLLSRLTYLIKTYAVTGYHDQPIQFVNRYYFHAKTVGSNNYEVITTIWIILVLLPFTLPVAFASVAPAYIYPKIRSFTRILYLQDDDYLKYKLLGRGEVLKKAYIPSVIMFCLGLFITLLVFHILAGVKLIDYGNAVFHQEDIDLSSNNNNNNKPNHQGIPITYLVFSLLSVFIYIIFTAILSTAAWLRHYSEDSSEDTNDDHDIIALVTSSVIVVNITYLVSLFMPFMILAFINDPLQTTFTYIIVLIFAVCGYLLCLAINAVIYSELGKWFFIIIMLGVISIVYFFIILLYILTLGDFNDYEELRNLIFPLLIGLFTYFVFKPVERIVVMTMNQGEINNI